MTKFKENDYVASKGSSQLWVGQSYVPSGSVFRVKSFNSTYDTLKLDAGPNGIVSTSSYAVELFDKSKLPFQVGDKVKLTGNSAYQSLDKSVTYEVAFINYTLKSIKLVGKAALYAVEKFVLANVAAPTDPVSIGDLVSVNFTVKSGPDVDSDYTVTDAHNRTHFIHKDDVVSVVKRSLRVGDKVATIIPDLKGEILFIEAGVAFVKWEGTTPSAIPLDSLKAR